MVPLNNGMPKQWYAMDAHSDFTDLCPVHFVLLILEMRNFHLYFFFKFTCGFFSLQNFFRSYWDFTLLPSVYMSYKKSNILPLKKIKSDRLKGGSDRAHDKVNRNTFCESNPMHECMLLMMTPWLKRFLTHVSQHIVEFYHYILIVTARRKQKRNVHLI